MIREVLIKTDCEICKGKGCKDCDHKGLVDKWIPFVEFINLMKIQIVQGKGIL